MKYFFVHIIFLGFSLLSTAQDDSGEELKSVLDFSDGELQKERKFLKFEDHFIDAVQERNIENYDRALNELALCEKIYPNNIAMLFEKAKNFFALKQYDDAVYFCEKALVVAPDNYWILDLQKEIYTKQQNFNDAIRVQKKMYQLKDEAAEGLLRLYYYTKNSTEGKALLAEVEKKNINIISLDFYNRYFNKSFNKSPTSAQYTVESTQEVSTSYLRQQFLKTKSYKNLQALLKKELTDKAFKDLLKDSETGLNLYPAQAKVYYYNGQALLALHQYQQAVEIFETGLDFVIDNTSLLFDFYKSLLQANKALGNAAKVKQYQELVRKLQIQ